MKRETITLTTLCLMLLMGNTFAGKTNRVDPRQVDSRLTKMLKKNIEDPWPGKSDLKNAPGVFSYTLACLHLGENVKEDNKMIVDFYTLNNRNNTMIDVRQYRGN